MSRVLERDQVGAAVEAMVAAFWQYPETVHLLPDEGRRRRVLPRYLLSDARDAAGFDLLYGAALDGRVRGAAAWIPPQGYPVSLARQARQVGDLLPALPWGWRALREALRGRALNRRYHQRHPSHFYLRAIGVHPDAQGKGLGSSLLTPVLAEADGLGVGCFLQTASADNVGFYERVGFEVADTYRAHGVVAYGVGDVAGARSRVSRCGEGLPSVEYEWDQRYWNQHPPTPRNNARLACPSNVTGSGGRAPTSSKSVERLARPRTR